MTCFFSIPGTSNDWLEYKHSCFKNIKHSSGTGYHSLKYKKKKKIQYNNEKKIYSIDVLNTMIYLKENFVLVFLIVKKVSFILSQVRKLRLQ